jgi:hypothetical protein
LDHEGEFLKALPMKSGLLDGERKPNIGEVGEELGACVNISISLRPLVEYLAHCAALFNILSDDFLWGDENRLLLDFASLNVSGTFV